MNVSVIATLYNEAGTVEGLIDSLLAQTRPPDEIVVVDAGSTDGTRQILQRYADEGAPLRVLVRQGNRSVGRNIAIAAAGGEIVAAIDGGCVAEPNWLEELIRPFDSQAEWVAGFYRPEGETLRSTSIGLVMVYVREEVGPGFMPSARSMAFLKPVAEAVGGFPEDLEFAEDTMFDQLLLDAGHTPALAIDAVVRWRPPRTFRELAFTMFRWGKGDGLAGLRGSIYKRLAVLYAATLAAMIGALLLYRPLVLLAALPLGVQTWRATRHKYSWAKGPMKYVYIPLAHHTARLASLFGFATGRRRRESGY